MSSKNVTLPVRRPVKITLHQNIYYKQQFFSNKQNGGWIDFLFGLFVFFLSTQEFFSSIDDFRSIHITPNHADQKKLSWNVHLDRSNGCPEVSPSFHEQALYRHHFFFWGGSLFMGKFQFGCVIGTCLLKCQFLGPIWISHKVIKSVNSDNLFLSLVQSCETYHLTIFFVKQFV